MIDKLIGPVSNILDKFVADKDLKQKLEHELLISIQDACLLYTSPSPRDRTRSRMPSSA